MKDKGNQPQIDEMTSIDDEGTMMDDDGTSIDDEGTMIDDDGTSIDDEVTMIDDDATSIDGKGGSTAVSQGNPEAESFAALRVSHCFSCFKELGEMDGKCPYCGCELPGKPKEVYHLWPGTVLKKNYELGPVVGFGGFGVVYKAWDLELERIVAVKEFFPTIYLNRRAGSRQVEIFDPKNEVKFRRGVDEFLEEARNIAKFNSQPNIVHVYDYFEENGTAYFVMEYMEGQSLSDYVKNYQTPETMQSSGVAAFPMEETMRIIKDLLKALMVVHKEGILHRDIKPGNIFILKDGTVKLCDFGAARFSNTEEEKTRTVILTAGYAPPEQYEKKSKQGPYTDIYAVGAVFYYLLCGKKPQASLNRKVQDQVEQPSQLNKRTPKELDRVIMRALALQPEIRYQTCEEFYDALEGKKKTRDAAAQVRYRKRMRNFLIFGIAVILLALGGISGYGFYRNYQKAVLTSTVIDLWVMAINDDVEATKKLYADMTQEFRDTYDQVSLNVAVFEKEGYEERLQAALEKGEGPEVFENPFSQSIDSQYLADVKSLFREGFFKKEQYFFFEQHEETFRKEGRIPLSFDVRIVYDYSPVNGLPDSDQFDAFVRGESNYIGCTGDFERVQEEMAGLYEIRNSVDSDTVYWPLSGFSVLEQATSDQKNAAFRLLYYLLSDNAQEIYCIEEGQGLPFNKNVWALYVEINPDFDFLTETMETIRRKEY